MLNPVDRAAVAIWGSCPGANSVARAVFASIDPDALKDVIDAHYPSSHSPGEGSECECGERVSEGDEYSVDKHRLHIAHAVIAWLTGEDQ